MRSCVANALEFEGVVYFCVTVRDIFLFATGLVRVWTAWMVGEFAESMHDLVRLAIVSWSPLELIVTCLIFGIVSTCCCTTPLEVMAVCFS